MDEYKSLNKYLKKKQKDDVGCKFNLMSIISRILICCILFLVFVIGSKYSSDFNSVIYKYVYNYTFLFSSFRTWYNENFGFLLPDDNYYGAQAVFNERLSYLSFNLYKDGVLLNVDDNYLVPCLNNGVVIFVGDKSDYGECVVVQQDDGINVWYCNINVSVSIYDYVNSGNFIGEVNGNNLYLVFEKNGEFLDYKKYI